MATETSGDGKIEFGTGIPYEWQGDMFNVVAADTKRKTIFLLREGLEDTPDNRFEMQAFRVEIQLKNGASRTSRRLAELLHFDVSESQVL